jgi:hypothetical protein
MNLSQILRASAGVTLIFGMSINLAWAQDSAETLAEISQAEAAEQHPEQFAGSGTPPTEQPQGPANPGPLFIGVDDSGVPAERVDVVTNAFSQAFTGYQVWGAAYDAGQDRVLFNSGALLYEWPVGGSVNELGTIVDGSGANLSMVGLAFHNGVLYAVRNIGDEAIWIIDTNTLVASIHINYEDTDFDCGGLAVDPDNGEFYCTNDDTTPYGSGLIRINGDGTGTLITPYPAGQTDIDGLAIGGGRAYLVTDDATGPIYVWDFDAASYATPLANPWPNAETFAAGAWIDVDTVYENETTFTVNKDFSDNNPASVDFGISCTGAEVIDNSGGVSGATEAEPAVFTLGWNPAEESPTCTVTEISSPAGYTADESLCVDVVLEEEGEASCTISNTQDPVFINADKIFSSGGGSSADFAVECTNLDAGGTVTPPTASASPGNPAIFEVNDFMWDGSTICNVTEPVAPGGTWETDNTCVDLSIVPSDDPVECAITNSPTRATFRVTKVFDDGNNVDEIEVSIDCNTGLILDQDKDLSDGEWVEFVVTDFTDGLLECTITEDGQAGYTGEYDNVSLGNIISDENCAYPAESISAETPAHECLITNYPDPVTVNVYKDWVFQGTTEPDIDTYIEIIMYCDSEIISVDCPIYGPASDTPFETPAADIYWYTYCDGPTGLNDVGFVSQVIPRFPATNCTITEYVYDQAIEQDNGCGSFQVSVNNGYDCVITNTVFFEGIPTLSQYGMALLALLMLGVGFVSFRRFS